MGASRFSCVVGVVGVAALAGVGHGVVINFNGFGGGFSPQTFGSVTFSTTDPGGFNAVGPGPSQLFIQEPGLEGTTTLATDFRVDFLGGATGAVKFGVAYDSNNPIGVASGTFTLFNSAGVPLASQTVVGTRLPLPMGGMSAYPEGQFNLPFPGTAAYGLFDAQSDFGRYIIDNFDYVPSPGSLALLALGGVALAGRRR
jgi:hypothetical protein